MSHLSKSASILAVAAFSLFTPASAEVPARAPTDASQAAMFVPPEGPNDVANQGELLLAEATPNAAGDGNSDPKPQCNPHGPGPGYGRMPPHAMMWHHHMDPGRMAVMLSAAETEIGIRENQLDAWRDFTDALLAMMQPPAPPSEDGTGPDAGGPQNGAQPFAHVERFANVAIARGKNAEALLKAVDSLRSKLTPEQLNKVSMLEERFSHHWHRPPFGPHPGGMPGHDGGPEFQRGGPDVQHDGSPQPPR